jgi:Na+-driven multidrug efflux pump
MKTKRSFSAIYWPILIELLFFVLMSTVDTLMLSNYSDHAVGSVGNANTLIMMFAVTLLIITNGVAVLVSQYIGAKRDDLAQKVIGNGIVLNLFVGASYNGPVTSTCEHQTCLIRRFKDILSSHCHIARLCSNVQYCNSFST